MKRLPPICLLILIWLSSASMVFSDDFEQAYFGAIKGEWVGDGKLTNAEGEATSIHEEWNAAKEGDTFAIRGTRLFGDDTQEFRWVFTLNASTELFECEYWHTGMESEIIFEVSLSGNSAELRTPFGEPGGELLIANSATKEGVDGLIKFSNSSGEAILEGTVKHIKKE